MSFMEPSGVRELSKYEMYNRINCDPMLLDFRSAAEFAAGHIVNCERIDLDKCDQDLNAIVRRHIASQKKNNDYCIILISSPDWDAQCNRILLALSTCEPFIHYRRCHCIAETLQFAPFLSSEEPDVGVPSLIECLLPAHVFLSGIFHASKFWADQLHFGCVINVTREAARLADITTRVPIDDSPHCDITPVLEKTRPIIAACIRDNVPVLIHCHQGVSRSGSVVVDYVASVFTLSADEALRREQQSRRVVNPNPGFMAKLRELYP